MKKILLHLCCGICASGAVQRLREEGFSLSGFFYNPNIYPQEEYFRRRQMTREVAHILKFDLILDDYNYNAWLLAIRGLESELEGGRRCGQCFEFRLLETYRKTKQFGFDYFATTLSVGPRKNTSIINEIGKGIDAAKFLPRDFKKQDGFKLAIDFSKRYNLYRQNYCGCEYSITRQRNAQ